MIRDDFPNDEHRHGARTRTAPREGGFTLLEIMIAVAIIGILAAIALPSYFGYIERARRTDATAFLSQVAGEQERHFSEYNEYARDSMSTLGYGAEATHPTPEGHYIVSISPLGTRGYTLTATTVTGGAQANDSDCATISITSTGVRTPSQAAGDPVDCW